MLSSQIPEVIVLALLSDLKDERKEAFIRLIIQRLRRVSSNKNALAKYVS